jgi:hypothetical protein
MNQTGEKEVRSRRQTQYQLSRRCNTYSWGSIIQTEIFTAITRCNKNLTPLYQPSFFCYETNTSNIANIKLSVLLQIFICTT